jgi:hypothetical protein
MPPEKLLELAAAGLSYDQIADENKAREGWRPSKSAVKRKLEALGAAPRNMSHRDLLPWRIAPEHGDSLLRHMLQAESRMRQGAELSETDRSLVTGLHRILGRRSIPLVVGYDRAIGFYLVLRDECDDDIIRRPR